MLDVRGVRFETDAKTIWKERKSLEYPKLKGMYQESSGNISQRL